MNWPLSQQDARLILKFVVFLALVIPPILIAPSILSWIERPQREAAERLAEQREQQRNEEANNAIRKQRQEEAQQKAREEETARRSALQTDYMSKLFEEDPGVHLMEYDRFHTLEPLDLGPVVHLVRTPSYEEMVNKLGPPKAIRIKGRIWQADWDVVKAQYDTDAAGQPHRLRCIQPDENRWVYRSARNYWISDLHTPSPDLNL